MAEQSTHDVVNQARSVGEPSPSDVSAPKLKDSTAVGDVKRATALTNTHDDLSSETVESVDIGNDVGLRLNGAVSDGELSEIRNVSSNAASVPAMIL